MHVGLYAPTWPPERTANGVVTYVQVVRDALRQRGHRVTVFIGHGESSVPDGVVRIGLRRRSAVWAALRRRVGRWPEAPFDVGLWIAETVARHHQEDPLDVFEMEESFGWCRQVSKRLSVPLVVKLHGPAFLSLIDGGSETPALRQRVDQEGRGLSSARVIVSPSPSTLAATAKRYALQQQSLSTIPNPVTPIDQSSVWRAESASPDEILFVGRFDFRKGGDVVLQAFSRIAARRPRVRLTFVGPDAGLRLASGQIEHFHDYVKNHLEPSVAARVDYCGSQPPEAIARMRHRAAVTVIATRWESFGYVVAEAMNQACPVVALDVDGVNELIEHERSGLLSPVGDLDAFAGNIDRLLDDRRLAARLGARARDAIVESCGVDVVIEKMLGLYRQVIHAREAEGSK